MLTSCNLDAGSVLHADWWGYDTLPQDKIEELQASVSAVMAENAALADQNTATEGELQVRSTHSFHTA